MIEKIVSTLPSTLSSYFQKSNSPNISNIQYAHFEVIPSIFLNESQNPNSKTLLLLICTERTIEGWKCNPINAPSSLFNIYLKSPKIVRLFPIDAITQNPNTDIKNIIYTFENKNPILCICDSEFKSTLHFFSLKTKEFFHKIKYNFLIIDFKFTDNFLVISKECSIFVYSLSNFTQIHEFLTANDPKKMNTTHIFDTSRRFITCSISNIQEISQTQTVTQGVLSSIISNIMFANSSIANVASESLIT